MTVDVTRIDAFMASLDLPEVYRVGGSVRDDIMGRRAKDADYMVRGMSLDALHEHLRKAAVPFKPLIDRDNRPLGVRLARWGVEVVLPRREISTGPGHRDFDIVLDPNLSLNEDAKRRDFTFNALYFLVPDGPVADPTACGLYDLQHKLIRTTHPDSFRDDPLRTLRALRFVSTLGYDLTADTRAQMVEHASAVDGLKDSGHLSGTVKDEFDKLLMGDDVAEALRIAADTGVLGNVFPELAPMIGFEQRSRYHDMTTDEHTFKALETAAHVEAPLRVRWALLFHDSGKPEAAWTGLDGRFHYYRPSEKSWRENVANSSMALNEPLPEDHEAVGERLWRSAADRMNVDRRLREDVATLVREHMVPATGKVKWSRVRRERVRLGDRMLQDLYLMRMCDLTGKGRCNADHMQYIAQCELVRREAEKDGVPASLKDLKITGKDVMKFGATGTEIGAVLRGVLDDVVVDPTPPRTSREWQLEAARRRT